MALTVSPRYRFIGLLIFFRLKSRYGVDLSPWAIVDPGVRLMHAFGIVVGPAVQIKCGTTLFHQVTLGMSRPDRETLMMPTIGRFCILGAGSKILGPVEVPDGSLVPANAVVTTKALSKDRECIVECSTTWLSHVKSVLIEIDKESCHAE